MDRGRGRSRRATPVAARRAAQNRLRAAPPQRDVRRRRTAPRSGRPVPRLVPVSSATRYGSRRPLVERSRPRDRSGPRPHAGRLSREPESGERHCRGAVRKCHGRGHRVRLRPLRRVARRGRPAVPFRSRTACRTRLARGLPRLADRARTRRAGAARRGATRAVGSAGRGGVPGSAAPRRRVVGDVAGRGPHARDAARSRHPRRPVRRGRARTRIAFRAARRERHGAHDEAPAGAGRCDSRRAVFRAVRERDGRRGASRWSGW